MTDIPILWSFRRCPYAMRARLGIAASGVQIELREILLRDKPEAFLRDSTSATVPCLRAEDQRIDESLDVMIWALRQNDPAGWLDMPDEGFALIAEADGPFKTALDRYKYATRHEGVDIRAEQAKAGAYLLRLDTMLNTQGWLFGGKASLADMAILPFVRQFAFVDKVWFDAQPWPNVQAWLARFLCSDAFGAIMSKYPLWQPGQSGVLFPEVSNAP